MIGSVTAPAGTPQSPLIGRSKTLTNNSVNSIFTFPLTSGVIESIHFNGHVIAKKGADWAFVHINYIASYYNDGSTLQASDGSNGDLLAASTKNNAGTMSITAIG